MRYILPFTALATLAFGQTAPSITIITNAALPALDRPGYTHLVPRSMATIFGSNLSSSTMSTNPPWQKTLGGVEVHVLIDIYTPCGSANPPTALSCDITADLFYVSPTQINFVVPDISPALYGQSQLDVRVVLIRDGTRFDDFGCNQTAKNCFYGNGTFIIDAANGDFAIFEVGYDCVFSISLDHQSACGVSWDTGQFRRAALAISDLSGNLITSQNPIYQGRSISLWTTGLRGSSRSATTGLIQQANPSRVTFSYQSSGNTHTMTQTPQWAGESPQFVGLDQINLVFPTCGTTTKATAESMYDAYMSLPITIISGTSIVQTSMNLYMPLIVRVGDPECLN